LTCLFPTSVNLTFFAECVFHFVAVGLPDVRRGHLVRQRCLDAEHVRDRLLLVGRLDHFQIWDTRRWQKIAPPALTFEEVAKEAGL
jgi:DNA-binding transcriptional regulator/RsmH inhibitor MraZ